MYSHTAIFFLGVLTFAHASIIGLAGGIDGAATIAGPSGIITRNGLGAIGLGLPGAVIGGPVVPGLVGAGIVSGAVIGGPRLIDLRGSGIEGQWIPDINEKLYDDGSYKPGLYH